MHACIQAFRAKFTVVLKIVGVGGDVREPISRETGISTSTSERLQSSMTVKVKPELLDHKGFT